VPSANVVAAGCGKTCKQDKTEGQCSEGTAGIAALQPMNNMVYARPDAFCCWVCCSM